MVGGFIFAALLTSDDVDDDDGPDGGLMTPVYCTNTKLTLDSLHTVEGLFCMPKNQVSVEELRCRIMKLKNNAYFDVVPIACLLYTSPSPRD